MIREILFRGKRIDNGEWVYGFYVIDPGGNHRIYYKPFYDSSNNTYHYVIPETVGQFAGLVDKHRNKIFEGDKVIHDIHSLHLDISDWEKINGEVKLIDGLWCVEYTKYPLYSFENEITGNIHDND